MTVIPSPILKVALLCGGPSLERGISLNSARSVLDHLAADDVAIFPIYFDLNKQAYELSPAHLYSNTPSDFDFKLATIGEGLSPEALASRLREMDIIFPAIHGAFGEDGGVQALLEEIGVPFVGSGSVACRHSFDKYLASQRLAQHGFTTLPALLLTPDMPNVATQISQLFESHHLTRAIVKPAKAGSSVGVHQVQNVAEGVAAFEEICRQQIDNRIIVEPFCTGREFTLILLQNDDDQPVALLPTEISLENVGSGIFDYRKKYLPTQQVTYHVPPRFSDETIRQIQRQAEQIFTLFGMKDCARFDGWLLPDGKIWFSDLNLVSGMEQNSFMFIQAAQAGFTHAGILRYILHHACQRAGIQLPATLTPTGSTSTGSTSTGSTSTGSTSTSSTSTSSVSVTKQPVHVIFGGDSSERQVSLMSGTNVWLKLLRSQKYAPAPYLLAPDGSVWQLPYALTMRHTVEEVTDGCRQAVAEANRLTQFRLEIIEQLRPADGLATETSFIPRQLTLDQFIASAPLVFIAIHGSIGENGILQAKLAAANVPHTGSDATASRLCMDKYETAQALAGLATAGIQTAKKRLLSTTQLSQYTSQQFQQDWGKLQAKLGTPSLIIKPSDDGCSSGVARLYGAMDWQNYVGLLVEKVARIPPHTLTHQHGIIELPTQMPAQLLMEEFVETDKIALNAGKLTWKHQTGWIEITVGVAGKKGALHALTPSITISASSVLSLEEKFQGGTGINITPPPPEFVSPTAVETARQHIETVANQLGIAGFARIDAFMQITTGEIIIIEANTIPALTPSTVIYHQALAESPPIFPTQFLEQLLDFR